MADAIWVAGLVKKFGSFTAVDDISFAVGAGEIFGILGPNGAGKTTTLEIIEGLQRPTAGAVKVLGLELPRDAVRIKARIGVQLQSSAYFGFLSLREILSLLGSFYPRRLAAEDLLEQVGLSEQAGRQVNQLSGGQRQRVLIALALARNPALLIGDEPTTALDETVQAQIVELLQSLQAELSFTTLLITHNIALVRELCARIMVMYAGQLAEAGPAGLITSRPRHPYTSGLLGSIVSLEARERPARSVDGVVPSPLEFSPGCRFVERCPNASHPCPETPPGLETIGPGHQLACYYPAPEREPAAAGSGP